MERRGGAGRESVRARQARGQGWVFFFSGARVCSVSSLLPCPHRPTGPRNTPGSRCRHPRSARPRRPAGLEVRRERGRVRVCECKRPRRRRNRAAPPLCALPSPARLRPCTHTHARAHTRHAPTPRLKDAPPPFSLPAHRLGRAAARRDGAAAAAAGGQDRPRARRRPAGQGAHEGGRLAAGHARVWPCFEGGGRRARGVCCSSLGPPTRKRKERKCEAAQAALSRARCLNSLSFLQLPSTPRARRAAPGPRTLCASVWWRAAVCLSHAQTKHVEDAPSPLSLHGAPRRPAATRRPTATPARPRPCPPHRHPGPGGRRRGARPGRPGRAPAQGERE